MGLNIPVGRRVHRVCMHPPLPPRSPKGLPDVFVKDLKPDTKKTKPFEDLRF